MHDYKHENHTAFRRNSDPRHQLSFVVGQVRGHSTVTFGADIYFLQYNSLISTASPSGLCGQRLKVHLGRIHQSLNT